MFLTQGNAETDQAVIETAFDTTVPKAIYRKSLVVKQRRYELVYK